MARLTGEATAGLPNVRVLNLDALAGKNTINPVVLDHVRRALAGEQGRRFKVVANLPYHIATPVITNLLVHPELCPELLVVTIQREMADRLCAPPASPAYGAVSVVVQALADVALVRALPPNVFWPRPKVDSAVVAIRPSPEKTSGRGRRGRVSRPRPARFPASAQVSAARSGGDLARAVDQGRRRSMARVAGSKRPAPRRGAEPPRICDACPRSARMLWRPSARPCSFKGAATESKRRRRQRR